MMPCANPCELRALKAQKYKAWGNAPGTQPPNYCRAVGAKVAVGVTSGNSANTTIMQTTIPQVTGKSAAITPTAAFIENRLRLGHPSKLVALSLHFFRVYSAPCLCGGDACVVLQALYGCVFSTSCLGRHPHNGCSNCGLSPQSIA